jgi:signal transduction histidine kinase
MKNSLKTRLLIGTIAGMTALPLLFGVVIHSVVRRSLLDSFDKNLYTSSKSLYSRVIQHGQFIHAEWDPVTLANFQLGLHPDYFQLYTKEGRVVASSPSLVSGTLSNIDLGDGNPAYKDVKLPNGRSGRLICFEFLPHYEEGTPEDDFEKYEDYENDDRHGPGDDGDDEDDGDEEGDGDEEEDEEAEIEGGIEGFHESLSREFERSKRWTGRLVRRLEERREELKEEEGQAPDSKQLLLSRIQGELERLQEALETLSDRFQENWEALEEKHEGKRLQQEQEVFLHEYEESLAQFRERLSVPHEALRQLVRELEGHAFGHMKHSPQVPLLLVVARESEDLQSQLRVLQALIAAGSLSAIVLALLIASTVVNRGLFPLHQLAKDIEGIDAQSLNGRVHLEELPEEILPVGERLNGLLDRLQEAFDRERRFSADVAHELRTPIAGLKSMLEVTAMRPRGQQEYQEALDDCLEISDGMETVVYSLLMLDKLETRRLPIRRKLCSVRDVIDRSWKTFTEKGRHKNLDVQFKVGDSHALYADPEILLMVVTNLLSNAVEHVDKSGSIEVAEFGHNGLRFKNSGCQLSEGELNRVFDRLWRGDRSRQATGHHSGLGLALVQRSISALGGEVTARLEDQNFILEFRLPDKEK